MECDLRERERGASLRNEEGKELTLLFSYAISSVRVYEIVCESERDRQATR